MIATVRPIATRIRSAKETPPETRDQLIERHLPLVTFTINRMSEFLVSGVMDREDAIGYGVKGLINAVDNFDPGRGTTFSSYAVLRIRGAVIDAARAMDMLPRSQRQRIRDVEQAGWDLATQLGRWPTVKELSLRTGLPIDEVKLLQSQRGAQVQSLEQAMSGHDEDCAWQVADPDESVDPANVASRKAVTSVLAGAVTSLETREREILHMLYDQNLTLRAIGTRLHLSESRVSQIHRRTLARLRMTLQAQEAA